MPQYGSKFRAFRQNIRSETKTYHPTMGVVLETIPEMVAEFGVHRPEVEVETDAGVERYGDISGFFYDLDADAAAKGWTDEEKQLAQGVLDSVCDSWPEAIWRIEAKAPEAPWATYDALAEEKVAVLAYELQLVPQALAYEQATSNRAAVVEALQELVELSKVEDELAAT